MTDFEPLIDTIYDAAFEPSLWPAVLDQFSRLAGAQGGLITSMPFNPQGYLYSKGVAEVCEGLLDARFAMSNIAIRLLLTLPTATFHSDADHISEAQMAAEPLYRDLIWPLGLGYAASNHVRVPTGDEVTFSVFLRRDHGPATPDALARLTGFRPHLARAATMSARNAFTQIRSTNQAMAASGLASAAINAKGRVTDCNALFANLPKGLVVNARDQLRIAHGQAQAILDQCLEQAGNGQVRGRSIALPAIDDHGPAVLHLIPVRGLVQDLFTNAVYFLVITPVGVPSPAPLAIIEGLFDLTASEARIAQCLAQGESVMAMAVRLGISAETVRRHLKNIYAKTGISHQAELAATIAGVKMIG